ncbi:MAG TPA: multicopper oxidase domain-containing protein [Iamia sp.]|nr:multicopper oxidase domain-containing protein [Iamia sp.]
MSDPTPTATAAAPDTTKDPTRVALVMAVIAVGAAFALSIAAILMAGGSDGVGVTAGGAPAEVHVALSEFAIEPGAITVAEGGTLHVENTGSVPHNLAVVDQDAAVSDLAASETGELSLAGLPAGEYTVICTISGHEQGGMTAPLTIAAGTGATPVAAAPDEAAGGDHAGHGSDTSAEEWARLDAAMEETIKQFPAETAGTGNEVLEPEVLADGTKHFELTAAITEWEVDPGNVVEAWTYNGMVPGPQIFLEVGDEVEIELHNELPLGTDLHLHGINIPNQMDGVAPVTQDLVKSGETFTYEFTTDEVAVAMYHSHHHAQMGVPNGLLGMIYVGDLPLPAGRTVGGQPVPADVAVSQEIPMVLNDAGVIGFALNGKSFPATAPVVGTEGDWVLIHYANEGTQIHPMHLHQMDQIVIAKDGYPLDEPYVVDTLNIAPGERYSVLVELESAGTWVWHCHILPHVEGDDGMFGMVTAMVVEPKDA